MTKADRLKPVSKIADERERLAAQILAKAQNTFLQCQQRLAELTSYRNEYVSQYASNPNLARPVVLVNDFRVFLARLDHAILQQQRIVEASLRDYENKKQEWLKERTKVKALAKVIERAAEQEQVIAGRKEQKELDEYVQRKPPGESDQ